MSNIDKVKLMHKHFGLNYGHQPIRTDEMLFRVGAMLEELSELTTSQTREDELDALVDLTIFVLGTAERLGYADVFDEAFNRVIASNMTKTLGPNDKRGSFQHDFVKGETFKPATLTDLV